MVSLRLFALVCNQGESNWSSELCNFSKLVTDTTQHTIVLFSTTVFGDLIIIQNTHSSVGLKLFVVTKLTPGMAQAPVSPLLIATNSSTGFPSLSALPPLWSLFHLHRDDIPLPLFSMV